MIHKTTKMLILFLLVLGISGCSVLPKKQQEENVSLKIVKSGIKIEDIGFDPDMGMGGKKIYKFTIPIEITGTFEHDCTIPIYYYFDMERDVRDIQKTVSNWAYDGGLTVVFEDKIEIKKGTTGIVYYEGETDDNLMNPDSTPYEHAWVALEYDDGFVPDNYAGVINPFFDSEKYLYSRGLESSYEEIREIEPKKAEGNVYVDEDSIAIEKTYIGEEPGKPQHYTVSATIKNDSDNPVSEDDLWIACDYDLASPIYPHDCREALRECMQFMEGVSLGYTVQQKSITQNEDSIKVEFDMYNRYVEESNNLLGNDLDWFYCFWIAICLDDENRNDNYVIVPNPYFNEEHYAEKNLDIYDYTSGAAWRALWGEKEDAN